MRFEEIRAKESVGWTLAHSVELHGKRVSKNTPITEALAEEIHDAGIETVTAYLLEPDDISENDAAYQIAKTIAGDGLKIGKSARGRCNIYAEDGGLFRVTEALNILNSLDPSIGIATLPDLAPVRPNKLLATIKIIPYAVPKSVVDKLCNNPPCLSLEVFGAFEAMVISSGASLSGKALSTTKNRLRAINGTIGKTVVCAHTANDVAAELGKAVSSDASLILLAGISAISDKRDVLPLALENAGGTITHLGMPVDPGNLLMLGTLGDKTVIGMPGCARSPSLNGFDWVLERFAAGHTLCADSIQTMGIGGLLKEAIDRPEPRAPAGKHTLADTPVVLLAAGKSSRSGSTHKLLAQLDNKPVIEQSVIALLEAGFRAITVVTGARSNEIEAALSSQPVTLIHNPDYADGMATSLRVGIEALPDGTEQCFLCLGDMPFVGKSTYKAMVQAANQISEAEIFTPLIKGKRGNPVLWRRSQFDRLRQIKGDKGGRAIIRDSESLVCDVSVDDPGILIDLDTPEALAQFGIRVTS